MKQHIVTATYSKMKFKKTKNKPTSKSNRKMFKNVK